MTAQTGEPFPSVTAPTQDGETINLDEYRDGQNLVVFFYPKAMTRGWIRETTEFGQRVQEFLDVDTKVVGVSVDEIDLQKEHAIHCAANIPLLCDTDASLTTRLGILNERGMAKRTTFLLDQTGTVRKVFENVNVDGHVDEVLEAAKSLS